MPVATGSLPATWLPWRQAVAELTFVGAAGTVTGSKHLVSARGGRFYVDCGMFQGTRDIEALNAVAMPIPPNETDAIVITHGHLDHIGYLPKIVKDGFRGPIYCTPPTAAVMEIVLEDAASIQTHLHQRGFHHERAHVVPPFYLAKDVADALALVKAVPLDTPFSVCGVSMHFREAGHILGSAFIDATIDGTRTIFSGDLGRYHRLLLHNPAPIGHADVIVSETTYGDRDHTGNEIDSLERVLLAALDRGGPVIIPAFAVERTQELLYAIGQVQARQPKIAQLGVHVDSPMAIKVDALFARFPDAHKTFPNTPKRPFGARNVRLHVTTDESKELNAITGPAIIIASSGMATGGRVIHHLHRCLTDPRATIIFAGWQGPGTLGRLLLNGAERVRMYGDQLKVEATIVSLEGFSAHADRTDLLHWLGTSDGKPHVYAVHGDPPSAKAFAEAIEQRLSFPVTLGVRGATVTI